MSAESVALWSAGVAAGAGLPERRLTDRFAAVLGQAAASPGASIPQAAGSRAAAKAAYRFLGNPRVPPASLLDAVRRHTAVAAVARPEVLLVQDTTSLNFGRHGLDALGPIDSAGHARGLLLHTTLALDSRGVVLGVADLPTWVRPQPGQPRPEAKESGKWVEGLEQARAALGAAAGGKPLPRLIHVADREGDCWEFLQAVADAGDGAVVRCAQDRLVGGDPLARAHAAVRAEPVLYRDRIEVRAQAGRAARTAEVEVRVLSAVLAPDREKYPHGEPMAWHLVEVWEPNPPAAPAAWEIPDGRPVAAAEPLRWLLWTREAVDTAAAVRAVLGTYGTRWRAEDYHLALKSGCQAEALQLETWEGLQKALVMYAAVAARIVGLRDAARADPEGDARALLGEEACEVLAAHFGGKSAGTRPLTNRQAVLWVGRLGGHLNRKRDGMPGVRTLGKGMNALDLLVQGFRAARRLRE